MIAKKEVRVRQLNITEDFLEMMGRRRSAAAETPWCAGLHFDMRSGIRARADPN